MNEPEFNPTPVDPLGPEEPTRARTRERHESAPQPSHLALVTYTGDQLGALMALPPGEYVLGRAADCQLMLNDGEVSRHHAKLVVTAGDPPTVMVEDLCSTNGSRLNEEPLRDACAMHPGDRLALGGQVFKLIVLDPLERAFHLSLIEAGTRDPLTGLVNRGAIMRELKSRFQLAQRYGRPLTLVLTDLDYFKRVNDTWGHAAGDAVLRVFASTALAQLREPDLAGRIGGEEFLILLPETDGEGGAVVAERLRQAVEAQGVDVAQGQIRFTCSLGIADIQPGDQEPGEILARADAALYRAKEAGRNRLARG